MRPSPERTPSLPSRALADAYYPTLDGWRAIAILGVTIAHASYAVVGPSGSHPDALVFAVTRYGALGVDLFFGISGFLICSRLLHEIDASGRINLAQFYIRRAFRILPPYFVTLGTIATLALLGVLPVTRGELVASLLFVRNYLPQTGPELWYTAHFWSLAVEEHFYLLWPVLLVTWRPGRALRNVCWLAFFVAAWRSFEFRAHWLEAALPGVLFYTRTDARLDALLWGCWMALMLRDRARLARFAQLLRPSIWGCAVAAYVASVVYAPPLSMAMQAVLVPIILAGTVLRPEFTVSRLLETPPVRWVGRMSYSLYLWQVPFLVPDPRVTPLGLLQTFPINIAGVFAAAAASYYLIERPMIRTGRRLAGQVGRSAGAPISAVGEAAPVA